MQMKHIFAHQHRLIVACLLLAALALYHAPGWARGEAAYHFLPSETVIDNVKTRLQDHGIALSDVSVSADKLGVVTLQGEVASKRQAALAATLAQHTEGVYAVMAELRYSDNAGMSAADGPDSVQRAADMADPATSSHTQAPDAF